MTRDEVLQHIRSHRVEIERLGVKSIALFGSTARGEAADASDVDLLVEFSEPVGLFKFLEVREYLEEIVGKQIDLVTPDALKHQVRARILREAVHAL